MGIQEDLRQGVHITPGDGIVALLGDFVAFASGGDSGLNQLIVRLNALADAEWPEIVRTLTADIVAAGYDSHPAVACAKLNDDRVGILVFGAITVMVVTDRNTRVLDGADSNTWIDVAVHGSPERIQCGNQSDSSVVGLLRDGVVPGGGFVFDPAAPIPAATPWVDLKDLVDSSDSSDAGDDAALFGGVPPIPDTPAELMLMPEPDRRDPSGRSEGMFGRINDMRPTPPSRFDDFELAPSDVAAIGDLVRADVSNATDELATPAPIAWPEEPPPTPVLTTTSTIQTVATPQLHGVLCPAGHLTSVRDRVCRTCGKRPNGESELHIGDRPAVGTVTFDDGVVIAIDQPVVIGVEINDGYEIAGEPAIVALIGDIVDSIAPVHAELRLAGWDVEVVSMSPNFATYTRLDGVRQSRTKLRAGNPTLLTPGTTVEMGNRSFVFTIGPG